MRQWVLSLPIALRYKLAYDSQLAAEVLQLFVRSVFALLALATVVLGLHQALPYDRCRVVAVAR